MSLLDNPTKTIANRCSALFPATAGPHTYVCRWSLNIPQSNKSNVSDPRVKCNTSWEWRIVAGGPEIIAGRGRSTWAVTGGLDGLCFCATCVVVDWRTICQRSIGVYWLQGRLIDRPLRSTDARSSSHNRCGSSLSPHPFCTYALTLPTGGSNADPQLRQPV